MGETELRAHKTPLYFLFLQLPVNLSLLQIKLKKNKQSSDSPVGIYLAPVSGTNVFKSTLCHKDQK